jgi:hypothetical protein
MFFDLSEVTLHMFYTQLYRLLHWINCVTSLVLSFPSLNYRKGILPKLMVLWTFEVRDLFENVVKTPHENALVSIGIK